jgi:hypothetical protein
LKEKVGRGDGHQNGPEQHPFIRHG